MSFEYVFAETAVAVAAAVYAARYFTQRDAERSSAKPIRSIDGSDYLPKERTYRREDRVRARDTKRKHHDGHGAYGALGELTTGDYRGARLDATNRNDMVASLATGKMQSNSALHKRYVQQRARHASHEPVTGYYHAAAAAVRC